jgi:hypothetical protein
MGKSITIFAPHPEVESFLISLIVKALLTLRNVEYAICQIEDNLNLNNFRLISSKKVRKVF